MKNKLKKWTEVYQNDEEYKFFVSLARHPRFQWKSVSAIAKETGFTKDRVEELIDKYYKQGMIINNPKNEDQWGYWQRVPDLIPPKEESIVEKDQKNRIEKATKSE